MEIAPWIFLALTLASGVMTLKVLNLMDYQSKYPRLLYSSLLGKRGERLYDRSTAKQKSTFILQHQTTLAFFSIVLTLGLAHQTYRAFFY